jgi:hypothetical protein
LSDVKCNKLCELLNAASEFNNNQIKDDKIRNEKIKHNKIKNENVKNGIIVHSDILLD